MVRSVAVALVLLGAVGGRAHADVAVTAAADVGADYTRTAPAVENRGLRLASKDGGYLWVFTGLDHTDIDSLGASARTTLRYQSSDLDAPTSLLLEARAW